MSDTIANDDGADWPVLDRPVRPGWRHAFAPANRTTALTAALSLVLLGGVTTAAVRAGSGAGDPATVVPASAFAFAEIDLSLPDGQAAALDQLLHRFPDALPGSGSARDRLLTALFKSSSDPHVDYERSIRPWLGDHAAVAGWTDADGKPVVEYVLASTDGATARRELHKASPQAGIATADGFVVVSSSQQLADEAVASAHRSSLAHRAVFIGDLDALGESAALTAWVDGPRTYDVIAHAAADQPGGPAFLANSGLSDSLASRVVAGLRVLDDGDTATAVQLDTVARGTSAAMTTQPATRIAHLPTQTYAAVELADPQAAAQRLATSAALPLAFFAGVSDGVACASSDPGASECTDVPSNDFPAAPNPMAMLSRATGLDLPGDLQAVLGTGAVVSYGGLTGSGAPKIGVRSTPSDLNAAADVVTKLRTRFPDSGLQLAEKDAGGDFIVATDEGYAAKLAATGGLGRTGRFADALRGMPTNVGFAAYVDLGALLPLLTHGQAPQVDHLAALGIWSGVKDGAHRSQLRLVVR